MSIASDRNAQVFADVRRSPRKERDVWRLTIWRLGGHIDGSAQPFKILDCYECTEQQVGLVLDIDYPNAKYAPVPRVIDDRLFVYDVTFRSRRLGFTSPDTIGH